LTFTPNRNQQQDTALDDRRLRTSAGADPNGDPAVDRFIKAEVQNIKAGLPPTDAREEAKKDWLMLEPEDDDNGR